MGNSPHFRIGDNNLSVVGRGVRVWFLLELKVTVMIGRNLIKWWACGLSVHSN